MLHKRWEHNVGKVLSKPKEFSSVGFKDSQLRWEHVYLLPDVAGSQVVDTYYLTHIKR